MSKSPEYLTTGEVAKRYRTAESTIRYWKHVGYIPGGIRRGRRTLYNADVLNAWDAEQEKAGGQCAA